MQLERVALRGTVEDPDVSSALSEARLMHDDCPIYTAIADEEVLENIVHRASHHSALPQPLAWTRQKQSASSVQVSKRTVSSV